MLVPASVSAAVLHWDAPEGCPDAHDLERETEQVLGESLARFQLEVSAVVTAGPTQLTLTLRMNVPVGEALRVREVQATSCQELMEAAAVAIALAAAESGKAPPPSAAAVVPFDPGPPEAPPRPGAARARASEAESGVVIGLGALSDWGVLPAAGIGAELQLGWRLDWLWLGLGASWLPARSMALSRDVRAAFGMYAAELLLCGQHRLSQLRLVGCAQAELGEIDAQLVAPQAGELRRTPWRALGLRALASYRFAPPLEVAVGVAAITALTRPEFFRDERESLAEHQPATVGMRLWLGLIFCP